MAYENNGNSADQMGLGARQLSGDINRPVDLGVNINVNDVHANAASDVEAREFQANESAIIARRKIMAILEEDDQPQYLPQQQAPTGRLRRKQGLSMADLVEGIDGAELARHDVGDSMSTMDPNEAAILAGGLQQTAQRVSNDLFHEGYMESDNEAAQMAQAMGRHQVEPTWDWVAVKAVATLRSGKQVPVWTVENQKTGMNMQKPFRVQAPADRIASLLNVSGNVNDPRITQLSEDYDRYTGLVKQFRKAKQLHESGDQNAKKTGTRIAAELRGIKQRLGIG